jgi:hypothetical protein
MVKKNKSNQTLILAIILGIFVFLSAIQAVQITSISQKIGSEGFVLGDSKQTSYGSTPSPSSKTNIPENIQELPQMVGGC